MKHIKTEEKDFKTSSWTGRHVYCVEVAIKSQGVAVRNSNDRVAGTVFFTPNEWVAFVKGVKGGEFEPQGRIVRKLR